MSQHTEKILDDDYPVYPNYLYRVDGEIKRSPIRGVVGELKKVLRAKEIKSCVLSEK